MSEISRFFGITISIRFREHPPPHFHAEYSRHLASIRIDKLILHDGFLPPRVLGMVIEWGDIASSRAVGKLGARAGEEKTKED